ncbi:diheme cytochrome c-553 [Robertkochia solimangrovi]|uniref:diheme cytochrome c-553 n=1 Tax=Robertkochia solimangrovi TaxID=2213046 RepID=UPI00117C5D1E|nr:diheme cytochrome c-553 [Robertkochia solimangrovi]TRZ46233.1 diheme cytochrome c-553 [Robertkochia solimangrovi]
MKRLLLSLPMIALTLLFYQCKEAKGKESTDALEASVISNEALIKKGEYLVTSIGCADCHTPKKMTDHGPEPDMDRWMMGYPSGDSLPKIDKDEITPGKWLLFNNDLTAAVGPWGISFAANLTPDETGLKYWKFENFKRAIREGKFKGLENSRPLLPPMPWENYRNLNDDDLLAMFTYLQSIKPIDNIVPNFVPAAEIK